MCGIYGAISVGGQIDMSAIKALTWANRERGTDSVGFFDSNGRMIKRACDPCKGLQDKKVRKWLANFNGWAIGGHTRFATQGSIKKCNAHPFQYGNVIGTHNGMVNSPQVYKVDSEYLIDSINQSGYEALADINGYWGLAWFDKRDNCFYLSMHNGELACTLNDDVIYYSSDDKHLAGIFDSPVFEFREGQVARFHSDGVVEDSEQGHIPGIESYRSYRYSKPEPVSTVHDAWKHRADWADEEYTDRFTVQGQCALCNNQGDLVRYEDEDICVWCEDELRIPHVAGASGSIHSMSDEEFEAFNELDGYAG